MSCHEYSVVALRKRKHYLSVIIWVLEMVKLLDLLPSRHFVASIQIVHIIQSFQRSRTTLATRRQAVGRRISCTGVLRLCLMHQCGAGALDNPEVLSARWNVRGCNNYHYCRCHSHYYLVEGEETQHLSLL